MPPRNIFNAAKAKPIKAPAKGKPEVETIEMSGVERLAAIRVLMGALKEAEAQVSAQVKQTMVQHFVTRGVELQSRPPNFKATDGQAEASCQLQVRGTALRPDEATLMQEHGIPLNEVHKKEETFIINPLYANNSALLRKVNKALQGVPGLPSDFIQHQKDVEYKATDETLVALFQKGNNLVANLLGTVATPACKPTMEVDFMTAWELVKDIIPQPIDPKAKRETWGDALGNREPVPLS